MTITGPYVLRDDVSIVPTANLHHDALAQIDVDPTGFVISLVRGRAASKILDRDGAALVELFREPRRIVEAVTEHAFAHQLDPHDVLKQASPLLIDLVEHRFLVAAGGGSKTSLFPSLSRGQRYGEWTVMRPLQEVEDSELYQVRSADGCVSVLKLTRPDRGGRPDLLGHEAELLRRINGEIAPRLLGEGTLDGSRFLSLEWIGGAVSQRAADELRAGALASRGELLHLLRAVAGSYAWLHSRGLLHGDVHPGNVLVTPDGTVKLVDFGLGSWTTDYGEQVLPPERGGTLFFIDPQHASARLTGGTLPVPSQLSEQFSLGALLYFLATGRHHVGFELELERLLQRILESQPIPFQDHGIDRWSELEAVLNRALSKRPEERFGSVTDLADRLGRLAKTSRRRHGDGARHWPRTGLRRLVRSVLDSAAPGGAWWAEEHPAAPTASVAYGAGGVALALLKMASARQSGRLLDLADVWIARALRSAGSADAFAAAEPDLSPESVGEASIYHCEAGVLAVRAMVAQARCDPQTTAASVEAFVAAARRPARGDDLMTGMAGSLLIAALLVDRLDPDDKRSRSALRNLGDEILRAIWVDVSRVPPPSLARLDRTGAAHGWAGILYATLQWCRASGSPLPGAAEERLHELGSLAEPDSRGLHWPRSLNVSQDSPLFVPGWCNGSAGQVMLWTLTARLVGGREPEELAVGAAWNAWEAPDLNGSLCCGLVGRAYGLLSLFRLLQDRIWLERAGELAVRAAHAGSFDSSHPWSLYYSRLSLAVLAVELEVPEDAAFPLFEEDAWGR